MLLQDLKVRLLLERGKLRARLKSFTRRKPQKALYGLPASPHVTGPQQGLAIVTIVKNEAAYLTDWAEFHLMLGVRHIFIYDNGSTDDTPQALAPYLRAGCATLVPWHNFSEVLHPQVSAYAHALANYVRDYRWAAFIDVDEFMFPVEGDSLESVLAQLEDQPAVSMPWRNFGPSGHETKPAGPVIANYTERAVFPPPSSQYSLLRYKTIVNPREVSIASTHLFGLKGRGHVFINDVGQEFPGHQARDARFATSEKLRLNHYFTRSVEEMNERSAKGRVSRAGAVNPQALDRRIKQYELATEQDTSIMRFVPELERRLARRLNGATG